MIIPAIVIIGNDLEMRLVAAKAAQLAFPAANIAITESLDEALNENKDGALLVILAPTPQEIATLQESKIPRLFPGPVDGSEINFESGKYAIVLEDKCTVPLLVQILRTAAFQYELLRENDRLRGDLRTVAYRINHDLRTPLGAIVTMGEVMKHELTSLAPDRLHLVKAIFDSTDEMEFLMSRIGFVLKASANTATKAVVNMGDAVFATLQRLESRILKQHVTVVQPATWPDVLGVASWLEVIWWNLLMNSLKHGDSGRVELGWQKENNAYRFWITDTGHGVPEAKRATLFTPFNSLHEPDAKYGLGLSIIHRLVDFQGGSCAYEPTPTGSRFSFTLPVVV